MYQALRRFFFLFSAEQAHYLAIWLLEFALRTPLIRLWLKRKLVQVNDPVEVAGITFPNRVGLAAGFDKDARWLDILSQLGFGHIEVGTVTPLGQPGNPKPRLFRLPEDHAVINRMGFNNSGIDAMVERLAKRPKNLIVGGNIGKNKSTSNEDAAEDYAVCFDVLYPWVDYFTVNVSSPNTPGLRDLQDKDFLSNVFLKMDQLRKDKMKEMGLPYKPIFLKIAPDLNEEQMSSLCGMIGSGHYEGIIATNTTLSREGLVSKEARVKDIGAGGLSGAPLTSRAREVVRFLRQHLPEGFPIIGVGGIMRAEDAKAMIDAGASLVQIYTGFIYGGPELPGQIASALKSGSTT